MLKKIRIRNFRKLNDLQIDRMDQINLFTGRNNSGKTTLLEALFLLIGAGNAGMTLSINAFRGIDSAGGTPAAIREAFWKPMFSALEMSEVIQVEAEETLLGQLTLGIMLEQPGMIELPIGKPAGTAAEFLKESPLLFSFDSKRTGHVECRMRLQGTGIQIEHPAASVPLQAVFLSSRLGNLLEDAMRLGQLRKRKQARIIVDALKIVEPRLQSVEDNSASGTPLIWGDVGLPELIPLPVVGEGMTRVARLILAISAAQGGLVLVDEIENGLHHTILAKVWQAINAAAKNFNAQIIATTHSFECMEAAYQSLGKDGFRLHRLEAENGKSRCVTYEPDQIEAVIRHVLEVR